MGKIRMLSESMIGKIAAGEVVERPVSALKELIENSLDAGASAITAEIREGGITYLRVTDNGSGIDESDIRMAFERHATSKISKEPELSAIQTLGFRGEALASIAAVSHVVMTTRTPDRETGLKVTNEGGKILKIEEVSCTTGTTVVVTDLFYNTPVRKGFMKKASVEAGTVHELMTQFILSMPEVSFRFINDGKTILHSPGDGQLSSAAVTVFGSKAMKSMRFVSGHANGIILEGYVGIGESARGNRGQEFFFVNKRMMHSSVLSTALETACRERVMIGKYPVCALHIKIAYESVDVNVHPNKLEVRFRDERAVSDAILSLVLDALKEKSVFENPAELELTGQRKPSEPLCVMSENIRNGLQKQTGTVEIASTVPPLPGVPEDGNGIPTVFRESKSEFRPFIRPVKPSEDTITQENIYDSQKTEQRDNNLKTEQISTILTEIPKEMRVFGTLFNTYILAEYDDRLFMIDQHAVHERLLYDRLMNEQSELKSSQELLVPLIVSLSGKEMILMEENQLLFESIGLHMERFGEHDAAVRSVPMILGEAAVEDFIREVISDVEKNGTLSFEKKRTDILQTACTHAVKGGDILPEDQIRELLNNMIQKNVTPTCPHGRPLVISVTKREIEKKFKRIQD